MYYVVIDMSVILVIFDFLFLEELMAHLCTFSFILVPNLLPPLLYIIGIQLNLINYQQLSAKPDESISSVVSNKIKQGSELAENVELEVKLREIR